MASTDRPFSPPAASDWECFLLPFSLLKDLGRLPMHETCREQLEHVVVPAAQRTDESIRRELNRRNVCAVSWRWSDALPTPATFDRLKDWSPMRDLQLRRLLRLAEQSGADNLWVDWACVPQVSGDTMKFINATYDIYSGARKVVFIPRIKELKRRGWPALPPRAAAGAVDIVRAAAEGVLSSGSFSSAFKKIVTNQGRIERLEGQLRALGGRAGELREHLESVMEMLARLFAGGEVVYPTFDYYGRAWTLAERLAAFTPSGDAPIRIGEMHSAGDAFLYAMSAFWSDAQRRPGAGRPALSAADLSFSVYSRGVDPLQEGVYELWDDMNRIVQLIPGTVGFASENAALAVICVEWLLHESAGASDRTGMLCASLLGECAAYTSAAFVGATMQERADPEWFRKYMHFQAGSVYGSTVARDLVLAVYRSCGLEERETTEEAFEYCLREVFGETAEDDSRPGIDRLCREAIRHDELHTHMSSTADGEGSLAASDFAPLAPSQRAASFDALSWHDWLARSGVLVSWWSSELDQTMPVGESEYVDVEQLYCGDVSGLAGLSLEEVFRSAAAVVYKLHRLSDLKWRLVHVSFSRQAGRCGDGLSPYRIGQRITLEGLLEPGIMKGGRAQVDLIEAWNQRLLKSLDEHVHYYWGQCVSSRDILVVS
jgi:hypothetical protein